MAQLPLLISFTAGFPAIADDVNQNFTDLRNHINGANVGTENIVTALLSRTGGPILNLTQLTENQIAFNVENSQGNTAVSIAQLAGLSAGKSVLKLSETVAQTLGDAQLFLSLQSASTIPAILVRHGGTDTFKLTRTTLDIGSAVTTTLGGPLVLNNSSVTGNLSLTGKETINRTSTNQFLELANTTTSKSLTVTPQTASFDLNINDTASAYNFKINGVTKAVIDNSGLDGSYLKASSVSMSALNGAVPAVNRSPNTPTVVSNITATINTGANASVIITGATLSITTSAANKSVLLQFFGQDTDSYLTTVTTNDVCQVYIYGSGPGGWTGIVCSKYINEETSEAGNEDSRAEFGLNMSAFIPLATQGTYTFDVYYRTPVFPGGTITVNKYKFQAIELG